MHRSLLVACVLASLAACSHAGGDAASSTESDLTGTVAFDTAFGTNGLVRSHVAERRADARPHAGDGQTLLVDSSGNVFDGKSLARYDARGALVTEFRVPPGEKPRAFDHRSFAFLGNDKIAVASVTEAESLSIEVIDRSTPWTYGVPFVGIREAPVPGLGIEGRVLAATAPDGSVYVAATLSETSPSTWHTQLVHMKRDGSRGFGVVRRGTETDAMRVDALVIQPDGKPVLIGVGRTEPSCVGIVLERHLPDGSLDASFGAGGRACSPMPADTFHAEVGAAIDGTGRFYVVGMVDTGYDRNPAVMRVLPNGDLDASFGAGGYLTVDVAPLVGLEERNDGIGDGGFTRAFVDGSSLVLAGTLGTNTAGVPARNAVFVTRMSLDGQLDASFAKGGIGLITVDRNTVLDDAVLVSPQRMVIRGRANSLTETFTYLGRLVLR